MHTKYMVFEVYGRKGGKGAPYQKIRVAARNWSQAHDIATGLGWRGLTDKAPQRRAQSHT